MVTVMLPVQHPAAEEANNACGILHGGIFTAMRLAVLAWSADAGFSQHHAPGGTPQSVCVLLDGDFCERQAQWLTWVRQGVRRHAAASSTSNSAGCSTTAVGAWASAGSRCSR